MSESKGSRRLQGLPPTHGPMPDTHKPRQGGSMDSFRTVVAADTSEHRAMVDTAKRGGVPLPQGLKGKATEVRDHPDLSVKSAILPRQGKHTTTFRQTTTPHNPSAKGHAQDKGLDIPTKMEILHAQGYGQVGRKGDLEPQNLGAGSFGANSQMIPYDDAMNAHTAVKVTSRHNFFQDTQVAESITQSFAHPNYQGGREPFFKQSIDGDRTPVTREEYQGHKSRAKKLSSYVNRMDKQQQFQSFEQTEFDESARMARKRSHSQAFGDTSSDTGSDTGSDTSSSHEPPHKVRGLNKSVLSSHGTMAKDGIFAASRRSEKYLSRMSHRQKSSMTAGQRRALVVREKGWR